MNRDLITNADLRHVAGASFEALDKIQRHPKGTQVPAIAALFLAVSEASGMTVNDLLATTQRMVNTAEGRRPEFTALVDYARNELN